MRPSTLAEEYREHPLSDGRGTVRLGPYYKHQVWLDGRNVSKRVPVAEAATLKLDTDEAKRLHQLTEHHTPALAKLICQASANASDSYLEAAGILTVFTGLKLDSLSFHRFINRLTPDLTEALPTLAPSTSTKPIAILYLENDGTGVPSRAEELAGRKGKQPGGSARTREAKLGCVFTQATTDKDGNPMRDPDSTSYVGTMGDCRASGEQLRAEAIRRGLALAQIVIFLGDGAAWIWENARLFFPKRH